MPHESAIRRRDASRPLCRSACAVLLLGASVTAGAELPADDPAADGWPTEAFHEAAKHQLEVIASAIDGDLPITAALLATVADESARCQLLRPTASTAYDDGRLRVERAASALPTPRSCDGEGAEALATSLSDLAAPFVGSDERHTKLKVVGVTPHDSGVGSRVLAWIRGHLPGGSIELHSTWSVAWEPWAVGETPRVRALSLEDWELVTLRDAPRGTLLADATVAVLGGEESFREQLLHGTPYWLAALEAAFDTDAFGHSGVSLGDVDGDGLDDLYLSQPGGLPNRLFVQRPDGSAADRSATAGVDILDRTLSSLIVDLDGDADQDLLLATSRGLIALANDGRGRFAIATTIPELPYIYALAAADYDGDGDLDLYAARYNPSPNESGDVPSPIPYHDANNGAANALLRNDGGLRFTDVTVSSGMDVDNRRFSFAAAWEDFDRDGDPDLYVANDFGRNCLYRNDGGTFSNVAAAAGVEDIASGMSVAWGDHDRDGDPDLYVSNMFSSAGNRITFQPSFQADVDPTVKAQLQRLARGNSLFSNQGDGSFRDVSLDTGVTMGRWAWGSGFCDLNNDGWEDLVVANGYLTEESAADL